MNVKQLLVAAMICTMSIFSYTAMAQQGTNTIAAGQKLTEGQRLISANKKYYLAMQADGNLCIYTSTNTFVWCSMLYLGKGSSLVMQADGNLVVYNSKNQAVWNTMTQAFYDPKYATADSKPVRAVLEDNGTLNLYSATNKRVWNSSDKPAPPIVSPGVGFTGPSVKKDMDIKLPGSKSPGKYTVQINNRGEVFYNGDVNLGTVESLTKKASAPSQPENSFKWPNSTVYYVLPASHPRREIIQKGIDFLNNYTTICMVARTNQADYAEFISRDGNWSAIGRVGGRQEISIENNNIGTVVHEVMHALGFHHTQCREDRDNFVTINFGNVEKGQEHNFQKCLDKQSNLGVYDYTSVMHYPSYGFAIRKGTNTITRKDGKPQEMGQWDGMSATDVSNIALIYPACSGKVVKPLPTTNPTSTTNPTTTTNPTNPTTPTLTTTASCEAREAVQKYKTSMNPGERLSEKEKLVSANGRFHFRVTTDGNFVIEEIQNNNNCQFKEVYRFPLNNGGGRPKVSIFSYNADGNICMDSKQGKTHCATTGRDATAAVILGKSVKLELTNDGRLRLVNKDGKEIWTTAPAPQTNPSTQPAIQPKPATTACGLTIKYQGYMTRGSSLFENEVLVSADGRYQLRNKDEEYVIEEVLNRNNCQFKTVEVVSNAIPRRGMVSGMKGWDIEFKYESNGDILMSTKRFSGNFSKWNEIKIAKGDARWNIVNKSTKLELTNEGILRLVNNSGQVIWDQNITKNK